MNEDPLAPARGVIVGCLLVAAIGLLILAMWAVLPSLLR